MGFHHSQQECSQSSVSMGTQSFNQLQIKLVENEDTESADAEPVDTEVT